MKENCDSTENNGSITENRRQLSSSYFSDINEIRMDRKIDLAEKHLQKIKNISQKAKEILGVTNDNEIMNNLLEIKKKIQGFKIQTPIYDTGIKYSCTPARFNNLMPKLSNNNLLSNSKKIKKYKLIPFVSSRNIRYESAKRIPKYNLEEVFKTDQESFKSIIKRSDKYVDTKA